MQYQYSDTFQDPEILFNKGVAAIDTITLEAAGVAVEPYTPHKIVRLPIAATTNEQSVFKELMQISVDPEKPSATAIIDTKKMTWDGMHEAKRSTLVDYAGLSKRAVTFTNAAVAKVGEVLVSSVSLQLFNGSPAMMWFAEMPIEAFHQLKLYELLNKAKMLTETFLQNTPERYDQVVVPAQQIDYQRSMQEIVQLNVGELEDVQQKYKVALDETGARVYVETTMLAARSIPQNEPEPKKAVFGEKGPVVFWLTGQQEQRTPFAVIATTSEAWLGPDQEINYNFQ